MMGASRPFAAVLVLLCSLFACAKDKSASPAATPAPAQSAVPQQPADSKGAPQAVVNGSRTMQYVKEIVAYGPRYLGSPGHKKVEDYLHAHLKGVQVEDDAFTVESPE